MVVRSLILIARLHVFFFARIARAKSLDMVEVMKYPLGYIPCSVAVVAGSSVKTKKAINLKASGTVSNMHGTERSFVVVRIQ